MSVEVKSYWQNYIDGKWVDGGAGRLTVDNPATGEPLAEQAIADAADVDAAVAAAKKCHESGVLSDMRPVKPALLFGYRKDLIAHKHLRRLVVRRDRQ